MFVFVFLFVCFPCFFKKKNSNEEVKGEQQGDMEIRRL